MRSFPHFSSQYITPRQVDVWRPAGTAHTPLPVIYMHDGQNLFDSSLSYIGVDWGVDETITRLISDRIIAPVMVVGIWNTPERWRTYMPQKAVEAAPTDVANTLEEEMGGKPYSDNYLRFIVSELKPFVDRTFATRPGQADTFIMGSSMGGLISLYALCEYPDVFGGAGCLSTHWPAGEGVVLDYMRVALPRPGNHKLYFDYGTETLDAQYEPYQKRADNIMKVLGYLPGQDWLTSKFPGHDHSERAWRKRLHIPLTFLLS